MRESDVESSAASFLLAGSTVRLTNRFDKDAIVLVGHVALAWSLLDYALRLALKRLEDERWQSTRGEEIAVGLAHGPLISALRRAIPTSRAPDASKESILRIVEEISARRDQGLYGQRNKTVHALACQTGDGQRIFGASTSVSSYAHALQEAARLPAKLSEMAHKIVTLTDPLVGR